MMASLKWAALFAVVAACVGYLVYSASGGSAEYYLTVSELIGVGAVETYARPAQRRRTPGAIH